MVQHRTLPLLLVVLSFAASAAFAPPRPVARVVYHPLASAVIADQAVTTTSSTAKSPTTDADADSVTRPKGAQNAWEVHKFGGASLATADLYRTVGDLLIKEAAGRGGGGPIPTMAIVSARGGMTDLLVQVVDSALQDFELAQVALEEAVESQITLLKELAGPSITDSIEARFRQDGKDILSVVQSLRMLNTVPDVTMEVVSGFGEIWSAQTLFAYLQTQQGVVCDWIDARDVLVVKCDSAGLGEKGAASTGGVTPLWGLTAQKMEHWWQNNDSVRNVDYSTTSPIVVVTGFVAKTATGVPTTLKRSGSDYSATIFAKLCEASRVTMWKNTNGVYTADPRRVPEAFSIKSLKYDEAMELAYFGAQVLHPSAMEPCIQDNIPVFVRNIFNPAFEGTIIQGRSLTLKEVNRDAKVKNWRAKSGEIPIKGITSVDKTALVTLEGASIGGASVAERFMGAMADSDINVLIISQASSESSITVAVPENEGERALKALENVFELELARSTINSVSLAKGMAIVAIVGEGMIMSSGVSSTFMGSLAMANVNIRLIAQGSSERQVAVVVNGSDATRALRAAHMAFTLSVTAASVAVLGSTGQIGSALINQLQGQKEMLAKDVGVEVCVTVAANSKKMVHSKDSRGLDISQLSELLASDEESEDFDLDQLTALMDADVNPLRVIVDCTNSEHVYEHYERWISSGINIVSPGGKFGSGDLDRYRRVCQAQRASGASLSVESSVGSALPIITTLRDLLDTGDKINSVEGSLSGTMAYVFSTFSHELPFSEAVRKAVELGYTENNVLENLSGLDTARKVVILARRMGLDVNLDDVEVESLVPEEITSKSYSEHTDNVSLLEDIKCVDAPMQERLKAAEEADCVLRYKFVINTETGKCKCTLEPVPLTDPLYRLKGNENLVAFATSRYETSPLIVKGAAAGPDLAAAGIFADLLRLTRAFSSKQN
jgi:aspartokinase/homoserine dehydrogenase 1